MVWLDLNQKNVTCIELLTSTLSLTRTLIRSQTTAFAHALYIAASILHRRLKRQDKMLTVKRLRVLFCIKRLHIHCFIQQVGFGMMPFGRKEVAQDA